MSEVKLIRVVRDSDGVVLDEGELQAWELQVELPDDRAMNWRLSNSDKGEELRYLGEGPLITKHWHFDAYSVTIELEAVLEAFLLLAVNKCLNPQTGRFDSQPMMYFAEHQQRIFIPFREM